MDNNHSTIIDAAFNVDYTNGDIKGKTVLNAVKRLKDVSTIFEDSKALLSKDENELVYEVQAILPVEEGTEGGLFYGKTSIHPGKVGDEYYMTKGHFHEKADRAEFYWGIQGEGVLLLMDVDRNFLAEKMYPGSLHYINGYIAHRTINVGNIILSFGACWPSDAGHNYDEILDNGFSARVKEINGTSEIVKG